MERIADGNERGEVTGLGGGSACGAGGVKVSLIIPVHNRLDRTRECLESVFRAGTGGIAMEILVVDDCSDDGTPEYLAELGERVRVLRFGRRTTFSEANNGAAAEARGEYLCMLNNDTIVTPGWLVKMLEVAEADANIGVVGNRHLTPGTEEINHAGVVFDHAGYPVHLYRGQPTDFWPALISQEFKVVTAACWLVRRKLFLDLGGFDVGYRNSFEDVDFCLRVRQKGYKVYYVADSVIYHYGLSTPGRYDHEDGNAEYFKCRWGRFIEPDYTDYYVAPNRRPTSQIEERYEWVLLLEKQRPRVAAALRLVIRGATSVAKWLVKAGQ